MDLFTESARGGNNITGLRNFACVGLCVAALGACGTSGAEHKRSEYGATMSSTCPAPIKRSVVRVVYGPRQATAVWMLPAGMLGSKSPHDLAVLQQHVADLAERMTAESVGTADRIVRYEPSESGAAITVEDSNVDRLDTTREEFDRYAALSNQGECATTALLNVAASVASAD
ncbi:MAG: hypothetical protein SF187_25730 [Deltaproteobacteria bacterium]|nr:hypothetical protein [Deltaproteobacteria bacterium]